MKKIIIIGLLIVTVFGTLGLGIAWHIRRNSGENLLFRANLAMQANQFNKAFDMASRYIADTPTDWRGHDVLGRASLRLGRYETAREAFQEAGRLDPTNIDPILGLASAYSLPAAAQVVGTTVASPVEALRQVIDRFVQANNIILEAKTTDAKASLDLRERLGRDYQRISQAWRVIAGRLNQQVKRAADASLSEVEKSFLERSSNNAIIEADGAAVRAIETLLGVITEDPSRPQGAATLVRACIEHIEKGPSRKMRLNERKATAQKQKQHDTVRTLDRLRAGVDNLVTVAGKSLEVAKERIMGLDSPPAEAGMELALYEWQLGNMRDEPGQRDRLRTYCQTLDKLLVNDPDEMRLKLARADAAFALEDYTTAKRITDDVLAENPRQGRARLIRAAMALKERKFAQAEQQLFALANDYPKWAEVHYTFGLASAANGRKQVALRAMRAAVHEDSDPTHAGARRYLITALSRSGFHDQAFADAEAYFDAHPNDPIALQMLVRTATDLDAPRLTTARNALTAARRQAVRTAVDDEGKPVGDPYVVHTLMFAVGEGYARIGDSAKAQEAYQQAITTKPRHVAGLIAHAKALHRLGRSPEAEAIFTKVLEDDGDLHQVHFALSKLCAETDRPFQAIDHMRRAVRLDDRNSTYRVALAGLWFDAGDVAQCTKVLDTLDDDDEEANLLRLRVKLVRHETVRSEDVVAQIDRTKRGGLALAMTYLRTGRPQWCVTVCKDALKATPEDSGLLFLLGRAHRVMGQKDKCIDRWSQVLRLAPRQLPTYLGLAELMSATLDPPQVDQALRKIPQTHDDMVDLAVAWLYSRRGNYAQAAKIYQQLGANSDAPQYSQLSARVLRARAVASLGRTDDALAELKTLTDALTRSETQLHAQIDKLAQATDKNSRAERRALEAKLVGLEQWYGRALWARADILADAGRNEQAYQTLKTLADIAAGKGPKGEPDAASLRRVVRQMARLKRFTEALALCEQIKSLVPNDAKTYLLETSVLVAAGRIDETPTPSVLEQAIKRQSTNVKLYAALAGAHDALNQPDEVLATLERMAKIGEAGKARALFEEGRFLASWGLAAQAEERFKRLEALGYGSSPGVQLALGNALAKVGSIQRAREVLKKIPLYCDQYIDAQSLLGDLAENDDDRLAILRRLAKDKPDSTVVLRRQMWAMIRAGKGDEATRTFQAFAKRTGRALAMPSGTYPLALQALLDTDDETGAAKFIRERAEESKSLRWRRLGILLSINNKPADAKTMLPEPDAKGLWLHDALLGVIVAAKTDDAKAAAAWVGVVDKISRLAAERTVPAVIPPHYRLLSALAAESKVDSAELAVWAGQVGVGRDAARQLLGVNAEDRPAQAADLLKATLAIEWGQQRLGRSWAMDILEQHRGCQWAAALAMQTRPDIATHKRVVELLKKGSALALRIAGSLHREEGDFEAAAQSYKKAAEVAKAANKDAKDDPILLLAQAVALERAGNQEEALDLYRKVHDETKGVQAGNNAAFLTSELYPSDETRLTEALDKWAQPNVEAQPNNPTFLDTRGWILHLLGRTDEALVDLRRAVKGKPASPEIHYHLGALEYENYLRVLEANKSQDNETLTEKTLRRLETLRELAKWHLQATGACVDRLQKAGEKLTVSAQDAKSKAAALATRIGLSPQSLLKHGYATIGE